MMSAASKRSISAKPARSRTYYYFKLKIMTCKIQSSQLACLILRHYKANRRASAAPRPMLREAQLRELERLISTIDKRRLGTVLSILRDAAKSGT